MLKELYNFKLLINEAHSFLTLGSGGRGCFEFWRDRGYDCPTREVSIMTASLAKSAGGSGGLILANDPFADGLQRDTSECVLTVVAAHLYSLLMRPNFLRRRLCLLHERSAYVFDVLHDAKCPIISSRGSPIICFPVGQYTLQRS